MTSVRSEFDPKSPTEPFESTESDHFAADPGATAESIFPQSVASGGPTPNGVILWTRVAPSAYRNDESLAVEVGTDDDITDTAYRGILEPDAIESAYDYTVSVDLDGHLEPDSEYYYRFVYRDTRSRTGRCRTLPDSDTSPARVRFGVVACQDYQNGYYGAYHHLADEEIDFLVHLGDFIYNSAAGQFTGLGSESYPDRDIDLPSGHDLAWTLADFRELYRTYLSTPALQRALERHILVRTWDDHAVANNRYWDYDADAPKAPDHPRGDDPQFMRRLTAAGIRAYSEYTPARVEYDPEANRLHDRFQLWRSIEFGDLLTLLVTDERLFRSPPPCADSLLPSWSPTCTERTDPDRTMLGTEQRDWFLENIRDAESTWTVWANEVLTLPFRLGVDPVSIYPLQDSWDGYAHERQRILDLLARNDIGNFVTLTGDLHSSITGYQRTSYPGPLENPLSPSGGGSRVGVELMTPAVTSVNLAEATGVETGLLAELTRPIFSRLIGLQNPHIESFDSHHWGYSIVEFTETDCTHSVYSVEKTDRPPATTKTLLRRLRIPDGHVEIR